MLEDRTVVADRQNVRQVGAGPHGVKVGGRSRIDDLEAGAAVGRDGDGAVRADGPEVPFAVAGDAVERVGRAGRDRGPGAPVVGRSEDNPTVADDELAKDPRVEAVVQVTRRAGRNGR